ncbi:MAG: hypothetical protein A2202_04065 [Bdellovibrionales bacterium RIFOXYA1_FULL_36_14]|nr:MAG: hypothetical protein A2202_04065 [Bdellovibrionales bacterium RIFOXYA1_FULL_36_14]
MVKYFFLFLFIASLNDNSLANIKKEELSQSLPDSTNYLFELENVADSEVLGRNLIELIANLGKGKINISLVKKIEQNSSLDLFSNLREELVVLGKLSNSSVKISEIVIICSEYENKINTGVWYLSKKISLLCRKIFFEKLDDNNGYELLREANLNYFKNNADFLYLASEEKNTQRILSKIKKNESLWLVISDILVKDSITKKIIIPDRVVEGLNLSEELKKEISKIYLMTSITPSSCTNEFKERIKEINQKLSNNKIELAYQRIVALLDFYKIKQSQIDNEIAWQHFMDLGKELLLVYGLTETALSLLQMTTEMTTAKKEQLSWFMLLWGNLYARKYTDNLKIVHEKKMLASWDNYDDRLKFWIAYTFEKNNNFRQADILYHKLIKSSFFSYYSVLSLKIMNKRSVLEEVKSPAFSIRKNEKDKLLTVAECEDETIKALKRLNLWSRLSYGVFISKEIDVLMNSLDKKIMTNRKIANQFDYERLLMNNVAYVLNYNNQHLAFFKLFDQISSQNIDEISFEFLQKLFPTNYLNKIEKHQTSFDPILILSLIRQESAFNTRARSPAGARGLMQIMPATGKMLRRNLKKENLYIPDINLELGIQYFNDLVKKYDGNLIFVLSAYNAGETAVKRWRNKYLNSDDPIIDVEAIPYQETRGYVKLIFRNVFFYNLLKENADISKAIPSDFYVKIQQSEGSTY